MIFKDLKSSPVKIVLMNEIPFSNFIQTFETNRYLEIPRITSKTVFDELCPSSLLDMKLK